MERILFCSEYTEHKLIVQLDVVCVCVCSDMYMCGMGVE